MAHKEPVCFEGSNLREVENVAVFLLHGVHLLAGNFELIEVVGVTSAELNSTAVVSTGCFFLTALVGSAYDSEILVSSPSIFVAGTVNFDLEPACTLLTVVDSLTAYEITIFDDGAAAVEDLAALAESSVAENDVITCSRCRNGDSKRRKNQ